jgi:hypothetical protein
LTDADVPASFFVPPFQFSTIDRREALIDGQHPVASDTVPSTI